jgi:hypothetical protein
MFDNNIKFPFLSVIVFMVGCSAAQVKVEVEVEEEVVVQVPKIQNDCLEQMIGETTLQVWCDAILGEDTNACSCGSDAVGKNSALFSAVVDKGMSSSDLAAWVGKLPDTYALDGVVSLAGSGIPLEDILRWLDLKQTNEDMFAYYETGLSVSEVKYFISLGLTPRKIKEWQETKIPLDTWGHWINDGISVGTAAGLTEEYDFKSYQSVKRYLVTRRFEPLQPMFAKLNTWVCSKTNLVAKLKSVKARQTSYLLRFQAVDKAGYFLPPLTLFQNTVEWDDLILSRMVERGEGALEKWSPCPASVIEHINSKKGN